MAVLQFADGTRDPRDMGKQQSSHPVDFDLRICLSEPSEGLRFLKCVLLLIVEETGRDANVLSFFSSRNPRLRLIRTSTEELIAF